MLGKTESVKPVLEDFSGLLFAEGSHGLTLLYHAQISESLELQVYLKDKRLTRRVIKNLK